MWFERETDHMLWKGGSRDHEERQERNTQGEHFLKAIGWENETG